MALRNKQESNSGAPLPGDKAFMIETLVFLLLRVICAGGLVYSIVRLLTFITEVMTVDGLP